MTREEEQLFIVMARDCSYFVFVKDVCIPTSDADKLEMKRRRFERIIAMHQRGWTRDMIAKCFKINLREVDRTCRLTKRFNQRLYAA